MAFWWLWCLLTRQSCSTSTRAHICCQCCCCGQLFMTLCLPCAACLFADVLCTVAASSILLAQASWCQCNCMVIRGTLTIHTRRTFVARADVLQYIAKGYVAASIGSCLQCTPTLAVYMYSKSTVCYLCQCAFLQHLLNKIFTVYSLWGSPSCTALQQDRAYVKMPH